MLHHANRRTVVGLFAAPAEGYVVVLHEARSRNGFGEVRVVAQVHDADIHLPCCCTELVGIQHLHVLVYRLETNGAVVGYVELLALTLLRLHLDDARGTAAAILGRFRCILQNGETLNVGRVDG